MKLSAREVQFCKLVATGMVPTSAARAAGYSDNKGAAKVAASRLMKRPDILALKARFEREGPNANVADVLEVNTGTGKDNRDNRRKDNRDNRDNPASAVGGGEAPRRAIAPGKAIVLVGDIDWQGAAPPHPDDPAPLVEADKLFDSKFYSVTRASQNSLLLEAAEMASGRRARACTIILKPRPTELNPNPAPIIFQGAELKSVPDEMVRVSLALSKEIDRIDKLPEADKPVIDGQVVETPLQKINRIAHERGAFRLPGEVENEREAETVP